MKIYYNPTQMRGKRAIFASIDPAEPKRQTVLGLVFLCIFVVFYVRDCMVCYLATIASLPIQLCLGCK